MVMMAAILPVMIIFAGFVIDMANWFQHDRHLQTQADAAALAGALSFMSCPNNTAIRDKVDEYSGDTWNTQVGDTQGNVHVLLNSPTYYNQPSKIDSTVTEGEPCDAKMVDVKATETDLPWWFQLGSVDFLNAHARVEFKNIDSLQGAVPFGVPDVNPVKAKIVFVDEDTGTELGSRVLTRKSYTNGMALWDNSENPLGLDVAAKNIGVRVILSGSDSLTCGDELVECYDAGAAGGVLYARGWSDAPAGTNAPVARDVRLLTDGTSACPDAYFADTVTPCTIGLQATVDFGVANPSNFTLKANIGNQSRTLHFVSMCTVGCTSPTDSIWRTGTGTGQQAPLPVDPVAGPVPITLDWQTTGNNKGSFGVVQRIFSASAARSGPIKLAQLWEGGSFGVNSVQRCTATNTSCHHDFVVKVGIQGTFEDLYRDLSTVTAPVTLRFAGGSSGSQNQALDCDPWNQTSGGVRGFEEEIALGCRPGYKKNSGVTCPDSPNDLWGTTTSQEDQGPAWQCVAVETGDKTNQIVTGMNLRVLGDKNATTCPADRQNNWPDVGIIGDRRIIHLFLTQFGAFSTSGQNTVAVTGFATFYVTGWRGSGGQFGKNPCQDQTLPKPDDLVAEAGTVKGHFIKYVGPLEGIPGTTACDFTNPTPCISALTE